MQVLTRKSRDRSVSFDEEKYNIRKWNYHVGNVHAKIHPSAPKCCFALHLTLAGWPQHAISNFTPSCQNSQGKRITFPLSRRYGETYKYNINVRQIEKQCHFESHLLRIGLKTHFFRMWFERHQITKHKKRASGNRIPFFVSVDTCAASLGFISHAFLGTHVSIQWLFTSCKHLIMRICLHGLEQSKKEQVH